MSLSWGQSVVGIGMSRLVFTRIFLRNPAETIALEVQVIRNMLCFKVALTELDAVLEGGDATIWWGLCIYAQGFKY
jgi:hypothetical protein